MGLLVLISNLNTRLSIWPLLACLVFAFDARAQQDDRLGPKPSATQLAESDNIWVLTNPEAPFVVVDDKRQLSGYLIDVVNGILQSANINQEILAAPWERVEREARTKSNVLVFALARTPERESAYHWVTPLTANVFSVFAIDVKKDQFKTMQELQSVGSIAVLEKDVRHKILIDANYPTIHAYPSWSEAIDGVNSGKSDAIFFSDPGIKHFCFVLGKDCKALGRVFMYQKISSYLTLSKTGTNEALVTTIKNAASSFKESKKYQEIVNFWLDKYKQQPIPMHIEKGVLNLWDK